MQTFSCSYHAKPWIRQIFGMITVVLYVGYCPNAAAKDLRSIEFVEPKLSAVFGNRWDIYLNGVIDPAAADRLVVGIEMHKIPWASVFLNSPGGDLPAAIKLGKTLRKM